MRNSEFLQNSGLQTTLHVILALILLIPLIFLIGILVVILDYFVRIITPLSSEGSGIGLFGRFMQYTFSSFLSLMLPSIVFKHSNTLIVCSVWASTVSIFYILMSLESYFSGYSQSFGVGYWLEIAGAFFGVVGGSILFSKERF
jgi:hypothetical protein